MGKCEGRGADWHGHVTVLTVAPAYRRLGIANRLMGYLESICDRYARRAAACCALLTHHTARRRGAMHFVDLFVRQSNGAAIDMYRHLGYTIYRSIIEYYSYPEEDAYGMHGSAPSL